MSHAAEESKRLEHEHIDSGHLVLALFRVENCPAAALLKRFGITHASYEELVRDSKGEGDPSQGWVRTRTIDRLIELDPEVYGSPESPMRAAITRLGQLIDVVLKNVQGYVSSYGEQRLKRKPWSRKEALGHLIDWAMSYHEWLARALTEAKLTVAEYPQDEWVSAQKYVDFSWEDIVDLWLSANRLFVHVLAQVPESKLSMPCQVGIEEPIALSQLVERYLVHSEDIVGQILAHL